MALCEHCEAEIARPGERLPAPWFDHDQKTIGSEHVEPKLWEVMQILWKRRGHYTTRDSFMALLYGDRPDDPPHEKIIDVFISKLRRVLTTTPYAIDSAYNSGYQLIDRARIEVGSPLEIGEIESGVPVPPSKINTIPKDRYGFAELKIGDSRRVFNIRINALKAACLTAKKKGFGVFYAGFDADGQMRVWRVEPTPSAADRQTAARLVTPIRAPRLVDKPD
jgi:DNA-binding winged helix-turn-helix (wHTH) protein